MATISRMAINLGWNGKAAESGLNKTGHLLKRMGDTADATTGAFARLAGALKGANDIKSAFDMTKGVAQFITAGPKAIVGLGAELETMRARFGALVGDFDKGVAILENLRQTSRDLGVPLADLAANFQTLTGVGVDAGDAEKLLRTFSTIAPLLGEGGLGKLSEGVAKMAETGLADTQALQQLQANGVRVYETLAEKLSKVTGEFHNVKDAQEAVARGTVLASTAVQAMQEAAKGPAAMEAAQRFANSFEGQLARLKNGVTELFRDVGDGILRGFDISAFLASLRGVVEGISFLVKGIFADFAAIAEPGGQAKKLEDIFKSSREIVFNMIGSLIDGVASVAEMFGGIEATMERISAHTRWWKDAFKATKQSEMEIADALFGHLIKQSEKTAQAAGIKEFAASAHKMLQGLRDKAAMADANRAGDMKPAGAGALPGAPAANIIPQVPLKLVDPLESIRDLQRQMAQGQDFVGTGKVLSVVNAMLQKNQANSDAWMAGKIEAGSQAASEAIMRHYAGQTGNKPMQEQLLEAFKQAAEESKEQTRLEKQMVDALRGMRMPAVAVLPR